MIVILVSTNITLHSFLFESMKQVSENVRDHLEPLLGLKLSASYRAADMRVFHFGKMQTVERGAVGEYALHVQCSWRIESNERIVTGSDDLYSPAEETDNFDWKSWNWGENETLQDKNVIEFLTKNDPSVKGLTTDRFGGFIIQLSDEYNLVVFPDGSKDENWRFFRPGAKGHFVISGGNTKQ